MLQLDRKRALIVIIVCRFEIKEQSVPVFTTRQLIITAKNTSQQIAVTTFYSRNIPPCWMMRRSAVSCNPTQHLERRGFCNNLLCSEARFRRVVETITTDGTKPPTRVLATLLQVSRCHAGVTRQWNAGTILPIIYKRHFKYLVSAIITAVMVCAALWIMISSLI